MQGGRAGALEAIPPRGWDRGVKQPAPHISRRSVSCSSSSNLQHSKAQHSTVAPRLATPGFCPKYNHCTRLRAARPCTPAATLCTCSSSLSYAPAHLKAVQHGASTYLAGRDIAHVCTQRVDVAFARALQARVLCGCATGKRQGDQTG